MFHEVRTDKAISRQFFNLFSHSRQKNSLTRYSFTMKSPSVFTLLVGGKTSRMVKWELIF